MNLQLVPRNNRGYAHGYTRHNTLITLWFSGFYTATAHTINYYI